MEKLDELAIDCSIEKALNIIGGKWSFIVIKELFDGTRRFGEIQRAIPNISPKALTDTLRHLESNEVLTRETFATVPVTVKYTLTDKGHSLNKMLKEMKKWGALWG